MARVSNISSWGLPIEHSGIIMKHLKHFWKYWRIGQRLKRLKCRPAHRGPSDAQYAQYFAFGGKLPYSIKVAILLGLLCGVLAAGLCWLGGRNALVSVEVFALAAYIVPTCLFFIAYASACYDFGGLSMVWLPWRRRWPWLLLIGTLPWLPFWTVSALRLIITWYWWPWRHAEPPYIPQPRRPIPDPQVVND